jgi:hypothetical protein
VNRPGFAGGCLVCVTPPHRRRSGPTPNEISAEYQSVVGDLRWGPTSVLIYSPAVYGPRKTLYDRWVRWARQGVWRRTFADLAAAGGPSAELMLDSSYARATKG